jgi:pimeloyl-ACP methyl ester carboxylesterase
MSSAFENPPSPVLVLLHGATGNGRMWDPVVRELPAHYKVLTPDLPGHGARSAETFTLAAAVEAVAEAVRSVAPAPVVLGGDSLGGYVSMAAAAVLPRDQVRGFVLAGCSANLTGAALMPLYARMALNRLLVGLFGEKRLLGERAVKAFGKLGILEADARALLAAKVNIRAFPDCVRALAHVDFAAMVAAIPQPALFINGSKDGVMIRQHERFVAAARQPRSFIFDGVEHGVSLRRARAFAGLVDQFAHQVMTSPPVPQPV